ncbi:hypothetical protein BASA81_002157 [Batrachochytrium salamandrivorans]|nr:hypothetical protein BASA81_002157 [Batrachochytrium salamandrivorans]
MQQLAHRDDALERFNRLRVREVEDWVDTATFLARFQYSLQPDEWIKLKMTYKREHSIELLEAVLPDPQANKICSLVWTYDGKEDVNSIIPLLLGNCPELGSLEVNFKHHSAFDFVSSMLERPSNKIKVLTLSRYAEGDLARFFAALGQSQVSALTFYNTDSAEFAQGLIEYLAKDLLVKLVVSMGHKQVPSEMIMSLTNCTRLVELDLDFCDFFQPTALTHLPKCITKLKLFCCTFIGGFDWSFLSGSNVRELDLRCVDDVDGNQLESTLAVYLKASGLDKLYVCQCGFVNETLAAMGIGLGRIKILSICCWNDASTKLIFLTLQSPSCKMTVWLWNKSDMKSSINNHLVPALKHPNYNLAKLFLFADPPHEAAGKTVEDRLYKRCALLALLQGQRVRRLSSPLQRLPVDLLRLVGAMLI